MYMVHFRRRLKNYDVFNRNTKFKTKRKLFVNDLAIVNGAHACGRWLNNYAKGNNIKAL